MLMDRLVREGGRRLMVSLRGTLSVKGGDIGKSTSWRVYLAVPMR